ncbi:hypothetical protein SAMN05660330_02666 [Desulforhopalus singaporensis]|uniref:Uncharacterized protein n=2 Tax=Desulforhopalus singaporensis TaxID=91360 RepID=A0A1H0SET8_9BACT|nr:hypothetical protein SAMN05660330_02666 [Desulforhopalus singaporensis]
MQCDRLINLIKSWYIHVREETMAPARMVSFMEQHAETCDVCLEDRNLRDEIAKITEMILPESKIPKAVRQQNSDDDEEDDDDNQDDDDNYDDDDDNDDEEDEDEDDDSYDDSYDDDEDELIDLDDTM